MGLPGRARSWLAATTLLTTALLATTLAAPASHAEDAKPTPIVVTYAVLVQSAMPLFVAQDAGLYAKNGLDVTLRYIQAGSQPMAAILSGQSQLYAGTGDYLAAALAGADVVLVASITRTPAWQVYAKADITRIEDLKGKRIGTAGGPGSSGRAAIQFLLGKHGMSDGATLVTAGNGVNALAGLQGGSLDAAMLLPPQTNAALKAGYKLLTTARDEGWESVPTSIVVSRAYLKDHRNVVEAFIKAEAQGALLGNQDPSLMKKAFAEAYKGSDDAFLNATTEAVKGEFLEIPRPATDKAIQDVLDGLSLTVAAAKTAKPADYVDRSVVEGLVKAGAFAGAK